MGEERRREARAGLSIPVRVQGYLVGGGTWEEISSTLDVCQGGLSFSLKHPVELGHVLYLSLPLPKRLRQHDLNDASYRVYSLVRFVRQERDRTRVGALFFGKYPPRGFKEQPAGRYLMPGDPMPSAVAGRKVPPLDATPSHDPPLPVPGAPAPEFRPSDGPPPERRSAPRTSAFVNFQLRQVDDAGALLQEELTVADNIALGGARVMTTLGLKVGDVVLLQETGGAFATRAEVRGVTSGQAAIQRLHLHFLDRQAPDRLLR